MISIGIDIGVTGAVAAIRPGQAPTLHDIPTEEIESTGRRRRRISPRGLLEVLRLIVPADEVATVVWEDLHGRAGDSSIVAYSLGDSSGVVRAVASVMRLQCHSVSPQTWKRHYAIKGDKSGQQARDVASRLYPVAEPLLRRVKDHNRAESLLLAHYGKAMHS